MNKNLKLQIQQIDNKIKRLQIQKKFYEELIEGKEKSE